LFLCNQVHYFSNVITIIKFAFLNTLRYHEDNYFGRERVLPDRRNQVAQQRKPSIEERRERARRRRKKQLQKKAVISLLLLAGVVLVAAGLFRLIGKRSSASEGDAAGGKTESSKVSAEDVLHLSFPRLIVDEAAVRAAAVNSSETAKSGTDQADATGDDADQTGAGEDDTSQDTDTSQNDDASQNDGTSQGDDASPSSEENYASLTVTEFNQILTQLYRQGYVLVDFYSLSDLKQESGYESASLTLPYGKKPLVLSERGVSYEGIETGSDVADGTSTGDAANTDGTDEGASASADGTDNGDAANADGADDGASASADGTNTNDNAATDEANTTDDAGSAESSIGQAALAIRVNDSGSVVNVIRDENGEEMTGAFDVMTCVDAFVEKYPDFSYNKARGLLAVTGADGVLGYNPSETSSADALKKVVSALKKDGWILADGTYGGISYGSETSIVKEDSDQWFSEVGKQLGDTDLIILPGRADIGSRSPYTTDNEKFQLLSDGGIVYYCVDDPDNLTWFETGSNYVRQVYHTIDTVTEFEALTGSGLEAYDRVITGQTDEGSGDSADQTDDGQDASDPSDREIENTDPEV
jgi:hypothetical protein